MSFEDYRGEAAIDLLADMLDPIAEIIEDTSLKRMIDTGTNRLKIIKYLLKNHSRSVLEIMALSEGEDPKTYQPNALVLPLKLTRLFSNPEIQMLFLSQDQKNVGEHSGTATGSIRATETE